jgi:tetratricopeptide (TPR) repeat protein
MKLVFFLALLAVLTACGPTTSTSSPPEGYLPYTTTSDSALHYFALGWQQIMDEGRYGPAEITYRKALSFDPDFLIGKATLGRLTLDTTERKQIEQELAGSYVDLPEDEGELLGLYTDFVRFTNLRAHSPAAAMDMLREVLPGGQEILGKLVRNYPEEVYLKCEYVELINSNSGAEAALDSLAVLTEKRHADNRFLLGFQASLEAEMGNHEKALKIAERLETMVVDKTEPKPWAVYADVYLAMDSLKLAKNYADKAVLLDPRNLDASRLKVRIETKMRSLENIDLFN